MANLLRKGHFLGAKLRSIRKRNGLTLEELSTRCIQTDAQMAPRISPGSTNGTSRLLAHG